MENVTEVTIQWSWQDFNSAHHVGRNIYIILLKADEQKESSAVVVVTCFPCKLGKIHFISSVFKCYCRCGYSVK